MEKKPLSSYIVPDDQRSAFAALTIPQKIGYLWHYYWLYLVIAVSLISIIVGVAASVLSAPRDIRLYIMVDAPAEGEQDALEAEVARFLSADGSAGSVQTEAVMFDPAAPQHVYEQMNVTVKIASNSADLLICGGELYQYLLSVKALLSLEPALSSGLDFGGREVVYSRAGSSDPLSEAPLEQTESPYAITLPDGRFACVAANSQHVPDAVSALGFIARGRQ